MNGTYSQPGTGSLSQDFWYKYDSMDRFTLTKGTLVNNVIVKGTTGTDITYNFRGDRMSATYGYDGHVETYGYTADGALKTVSIGGVLSAKRGQRRVRTGERLHRVSIERHDGSVDAVDDL